MKHKPLSSIKQEELREAREFYREVNCIDEFTPNNIYETVNGQFFMYFESEEEDEMPAWSNG